MRVITCAVVVAWGLCAPASAKTKQSVGVVKAERRPIEKSLDLVGRIEAVNRVEIRARVQGFLEAVLFEEGDPINDPLHRIDG
jgi:membrane fusion protein (multidrug efflux system)